MPVEDPVLFGDQVRHNRLKIIAFLSYDLASDGRGEIILLTKPSKPV
jgi:hypothetical protein